MRPISVSIPVATTTAVARPRTALVALNTRFLRSAICVSTGRTPVDFATGMLSPVSADSSVSKWTLSNNRASAGMRSPWANVRRSPGMTSAEGICRGEPSRITVASGAASSLSAWIDVCAR